MWKDLVDYHLSQPRSGNLYRRGFDTDLVEVGSELRDHWDLDAGGYIGEPHSQTHHSVRCGPALAHGQVETDEVVLRVPLVVRLQNTVIPHFHDVTVAATRDVRPLRPLPYGNSLVNPQVFLYLVHHIVNYPSIDGNQQHYGNHGDSDPQQLQFGGRGILPLGISNGHPFNHGKLSNTTKLFRVCND